MTFERVRESASFAEVVAAFNRLEEELDLFRMRIAGVPIWDLLRFPVFDDLIGQRGIYGERTSKPAGEARWRAWLGLGAAKAIVGGPGLPVGIEFCFFGSGIKRYRRNQDGYDRDVYCEPFIGELGVERCMLLEGFESGTGHQRPVLSDHVRFVDILHYSARLLRLMPRYRVHFSSSEGRKLDDVASALEEVFGVSLPVRERATALVARHLSRVAVYRFWLSRVRPKAVFLVCSYGKEALIDAARKEDIPSIELQHGVIGPLSVAYEFPRVGAKELVPDYFLSMGDFWGQSFRCLLSGAEVRVIGFPQISDHPFRVDAHRKLVLFISQWSIGERLTRTAVELRTLLDSDWEIAYKLHPQECADWKQRYPKLENSGVKVIADSSQSIYPLLETAAVQVGVYSTAIYEGVAAGCRTYILDAPGAEYMAPLIAMGAARKIHSAADIDLSAPGPEGMAETLFASDWRERFREFLDEQGWHQTH